MRNYAARLRAWFMIAECHCAHSRAASPSLQPFSFTCFLIAAKQAADFAGIFRTRMTPRLHQLQHENVGVIHKNINSKHHF